MTPKRGNLMRAAWWWIDRWRKSTAYTDMTLAEQGAYRNLLDELWLRGGVIPNDERILAKVSGDALEWPNVRDKVLARFERTDDGCGWRNNTHDEVSAWPAAQAKKGIKRAAGAARHKGRFTSRPPAKAPAGPPAENQPQPPAQHQPPSPSPSPSPSPYSGSNGERTSVAVAPVEAPTWSSEACDDWQQRFGGTAPGGRIGKALKPLVSKYGWDTIRPAWKRYLAEKDAEFATPQDFASKLGEWLHKHIGSAKGQQFVARTKAVLSEWLEKRSSAHG